MANTAKRKHKKSGKAVRSRAATPANGLTQANTAALEGFFSAMENQVVPEIVREEEERRVLAAESRRWPLKS